MIKLIAADMDGTLLNENREVTPETCKAIKKANEAGIEFVIATGRGYTSAMGVLEKYDFPRSYILASGGEMRDKEGKVEKRVLMDFETSKAIYEKCKKYPVTVHFCGDEHDYGIGTKEEVDAAIRRELSSFTGIPMDEITEEDIFRDSWNRLVRLDHIDQLEGCEIYKVFIFSEDVEMLEKMDRELEQVPDIASASSFPTNLEITHINAQKGIALTELAKERGLDLSEIMALGDSRNDESMLSLPIGAPVAMENADARIRAICPYMTDSNTEDGVAKAIYHAIDDTLEEMNSLERKHKALKKVIQKYAPVTVAYSGGVDSTLLLKVALSSTQPGQVMAVMADGPMVPRSEIQAAKEYAEKMDIPVTWIPADVMSVKEFAQNDPKRCYYCKKYLFSQIVKIAKEQGRPCVLDGTNADDLKDYRPGRQALAELEIKSPFAEVTLTKKEIRQLSELYGLDTAQKPAMACLATRIPSGTPVTLEKLSLIEQGEEKLKGLGLSQYRLRLIGRDGSIECLTEEMELVNQAWDQLGTELKEIGFDQVTIDPEGYVTGKMNQNQ